MKTLLEITLNKLQKSTVDAFPTTKKRQNAVGTVKVATMTYIPYEKSNSLKVESDVTSETSRYKCSMLFSDVFYESEKTSELVTFRGVDGRDFNIHQIDPNVVDVKVNCTCMDFRYRFAQTNYQNDGLDGNPPPAYVKKTDREPVNPSNSPGMCKHLLRMYEQLQINNLIK